MVNITEETLLTFCGEWEVRTMVEGSFVGIVKDTRLAFLPNDKGWVTESSGLS